MLPSPSTYPRIKCLIKSLDLNIDVSGNFKIKDLLGTHPRAFKVCHKCLLPTVHLHLFAFLSIIT